MSILDRIHRGPRVVGVTLFAVAAIALGAYGLEGEDSGAPVGQAARPAEPGSGTPKDAQRGVPAGEACELVAPAGCSLVAADEGEGAPEEVWGRIDCVDSRRVEEIDGFRRLRVIDGDDLEGERCELGRNEHRYGSGGGEGTFQVYREGERKLTEMTVRLSDSFPLRSDRGAWQLVAQMKQTQPADNGGGPPVLALHAVDGRWRLLRGTREGEESEETDELWSAPARTEQWTRIAFDVTYARDRREGRVRMFVDTDGDGDFSGPEESSPTFETFTMRRESGTDPSDGEEEDEVAEGEPIPSHLRIGIYHDSAFVCPPQQGCALDYDSVRVYRIG